LVVLQKGVAPIGFRYNGISIEQLPEPSPDLVEKAVGHATWAADAYQNGSYKVKPIARSATGKLVARTTQSTAINN
jgi:hypothetical protein